MIKRAAVVFISGKGTASVTNSDGQILVSFSKDLPEAKLSQLWQITDLSLSTGMLAPMKWVESLLQKGFVPEFLKTMNLYVGDFGRDLFKPYSDIEDCQFKEFHYVIQNSLASVDPSATESHLALSFDTKVILNEHSTRDAYRRVASSVIGNSADFGICIAAQLIPNVLDVVSHGGYFDAELPPEIWGFSTSKVRELFVILPDLENRYNGEEKFSTFCQIDSVKNVDQRHGAALLQLITSQSCYLTIPKTADIILSINMSILMDYYIDGYEKRYGAGIEQAKLSDFIESPVLLPEGRKILEEHLKLLVEPFKHSAFVVPTLEVSPLRQDKLKFDGFILESNQKCFYYTEEKKFIPSEDIIETEA